MNSIRTRLMLMLLVGTLFILPGGGWLVYRTVFRTVLAEFDYALQTKAHDFAALIEKDNDTYEFEFAEKRMPEFERENSPEFYQVTLAGGEVLVRSPSLGADTLSLPPGSPGESSTFRLELPGGVSGRAAVSVVDVEGDLLTLVVARDTAHLEHRMRMLLSGTVIGSLILIPLFLLGLGWVVSKGLRPLHHFKEQVDSIRADMLNVSFASSDLPAELQPIARQLDRMLARIRETLQRERYLTSAMAHELNTPIAELRAATELAAKWPGDSQSAAAVIEEAHAVALQMESVVTALLTLSRCEAGRQQVETESVDVAKLLQEELTAVMPQLEKKSVKMQRNESAAKLRTDPFMLRMILSNLLRNAADYVTLDGLFSCTLLLTREKVRIELANTTGQLKAEDLPHLFEPLWRKDPSRTGTVHCGLGLTLTRRFCDLLGIRISASMPEPELFEIALEIPLNADV